MGHPVYLVENNLASLYVRKSRFNTKHRRSDLFVTAVNPVSSDRSAVVPCVLCLFISLATVFRVVPRQDGTENEQQQLVKEQEQRAASTSTV